MKTINDIWNFFDGKKTAIGAGLMIASDVMAMFPATAAAAPAVNYVGAALAGVGLLHKSAK